MNANDDTLLGVNVPRAQKPTGSVAEAGAANAATTRPLPVPTDISRPYWEGAARGELLVQRCESCGRHQFYPRAFCTECLSDSIRWVKSQGKGTIYSYTVNHRGPSAYFKGRTPYVVALIDLDEGVRLMANVLDGPVDAMKIGARVTVSFEVISEALALPQFALEGA